jgi:hypothetical protein
MGFELESDRVSVPGHRVAFIGPHHNPKQGTVGSGERRVRDWKKVKADRGAGTLEPGALRSTGTGIDRKVFKRRMSKLGVGLLGRGANTKRIPVKKGYGATRKRGTTL